VPDSWVAVRRNSSSSPAGSFSAPASAVTVFADGTGPPVWNACCTTVRLSLVRATRSVFFSRARASPLSSFRRSSASAESGL
jgi:hypothetical protein